MTAPWPSRDGLRITGVRAVVTAPEGVNLVVVRVDTSDPGLYGLGCATFHQRFAAVVATLTEHVAPLLIGRHPADIGDLARMVHFSSYWRDGPVLEPAIWAENVPFAETRDYVKKVLSNATYYAVQLGSAPPSLRQRLGRSIAPAGQVNPLDKELP